MTAEEMRLHLDLLDNEELVDEMVWLLGKGREASAHERRKAIVIKRLILERMGGEKK